MRGRNIKITVITRPLKELDYGLDAIKLLEKWGCVVKQRSRTHEKVVFIDNQIAYYGSLNTLSHRDTRETMHRIQGDAVVDLLYQFLDVLRSDAKPPKHSGSSSTWLNREECRSKLKNVRKIIGTQRHIPFQAILFNNTIEYLLDYPAVSEEDLMASFRDCGEKQLQHLAPFLDEILSILQRYRP